MNCYDCLLDGRATPAAAICNNCGAALCVDHVQLKSQDHSIATPGNPSHHRTRRLVCSGCDLSLLRTVA